MANPTPVVSWRRNTTIQRTPHIDVTEWRLEGRNMLITVKNDFAAAIILLRRRLPAYAKQWESEYQSQTY